MAGRVAPGGNTTISLGSESSGEVFAQRQRERGAAFETPAARARFPQAPGGDSSIEFGAAAAAASGTGGPVGGKTTIILGSDASDAAFAEYQNGRAGPAETPDAAPRFPHAPGGASTVCLGGAPQEVVASRGPVGGPVSVCLGTEPAEARFESPATCPQGSPEAAARFPQAPGGTSHICLGDSGEREPHIVRGPVGGATSIVLSDMVDEEQEVKPATRGPIGGVDTVTLGSDDSSRMFAEEDRRRIAEIETPNPAARFPQAPGGHSTVCLGGAVENVPASVRGPVGGADTVSLAFDAKALGDVIHARGPVGGAATVVLGGDDSAEMWAQQNAQRSTVVETPDALPRFPQAPGGTSSIELGGSGPVNAVPTRGPVGGQSTFELGAESSAEVFAQRKAERDAKLETPDPSSRFSQAPGGNSTIDFAAAPELLASPPRGPVGGAATLVLGSADSKAEFQQYAAQRAAPSKTPDASVRFPQAPGGNSTVVLGGASPEATVGVRGPVGGASSVSFGDETAASAYSDYDRQHVRLVATPDALPRFPQAPGGASSIDFSASIPALPTLGALPVGGKDTLVLGIDDSKAFFDERKSEKSAAHETPDAGPRFPQAPGGTATIKLGGPMDASECAGPGSSPQRVAPGGNSAMVLGGGYPHDLVAQGLAHASGERSSTRRVAPPGGKSTICLGAPEEAREGASHVSSNKFACGANQNAGNVLTERSTTRLHQAPGGNSSLQLGGDYPNDSEVRTVGERRRCKGLQQSPGGNSTLSLGDGSEAAPAQVSSSKFACGSNQNAGNVITGRSSTRVQQAPGGASTICLGVGDENVDTSNVVGATATEKEAIQETPVKSTPAPVVVESPSAVA